MKRNVEDIKRDILNKKRGIGMKYFSKVILISVICINVVSLWIIFSSFLPKNMILFYNMNSFLIIFFLVRFLNFYLKED